MFTVRCSLFIVRCSSFIVHGRARHTLESNGAYLSVGWAKQSVPIREKVGGHCPPYEFPGLSAFNSCSSKRHSGLGGIQYFSNNISAQLSRLPVSFRIAGFKTRFATILERFAIHTNGLPNRRVSSYTRPETSGPFRSPSLNQF